MPLQNGLRPVDELSSGATDTGQGFRIPTQDTIRMPGLQPVAAPVDTYVRPASPPPVGEQAQQLANSLQGLVPSLAAYTKVQEAQQRQDMPGKVSAALTGKTAADQRQVLATNPDMQSHLAQTLGQRMLGASTADDTLNRLRTEYATGGFNRQSGNFDQWVNGAIQNDLANNKDPHFAETYGDRMRAGIETLKGAQLKYAADQKVQDQDQLLYNSFKSTIGNAIDKGQTPEQAFAALRQTMATTNTVANRPVQEQEQVLVQQLGRMSADLSTDPQYAQKYAMLKGILTADRTGPDGKPIGSLVDSTTVGGMASDVLRRARVAFDQRDMGVNSSAVSDINNKARNADPSYKTDLQQMQKDHPDWTSSEHAVQMDNTFNHAVQMKQDQQRKADLAANYQVQKDRVVSLDGIPKLQAGNVHAMMDRVVTGKDGTPEVYSAKDQIADTVAAAQKSIDAKYAGQDSPDAQKAKLTEEVQLYGSNGITNQAWKTSLNAGVLAASTVTQAGGDPPPTLAQGYGLYKQLQAAAPNLLGGLVDGKAAKFYQIASNAEQSMRMDQKQALSLATKATSDPTWDKSDPGISKRDKDQKVQAALNEGWFQQHLPATVNSSDVIVETSRAADDLHKGLGMPYDDAIKAAAKMVSPNYQIINGTAVRTAGRNVPSNFGQLASDYIDQWYDARKDELSKLGAGKDDLTIRTLGSTDNWAIYIKGHPAPLQLPGAAFSVPSLAAQQQKLDDVERDRVDMQVDRAQQRAQRRNEPYVQLGDPDSSFSFSLFPPRRDHTMDGHKGFLAEEAAREAGARAKYAREHGKQPDGPPQPTTMQDLGGTDSAIIRP